MTTLRLPITLEITVSAEVLDDGTVRSAQAANIAEKLLQFVQESYSKEALAKKVAHATRARVSEGFVRVYGHSMFYMQLVKSTKTHFVLQDVAAQFPSDKFNRKTGRIVNADAWHPRYIHDEDLTELNKRNP